MPYRALYWMILYLLCAHYSRSQSADTLSPAVVEQYSYQLYLGKEWKQLDHFCDKAFRQDYDYYYLRMRAGIASYETGNYRKAIRHFLKALDFNSGDETATNYLYSSYTYAGYEEEARALSRRMDTIQLRVVNANHLKALSFLTVEAAVKLSDSSAKFKPVAYGQLNFKHSVSKRFSLFHALSYYGQAEFRGEIQQYQYYLSAGIPLKHRLFISPAVHVLYTDASFQEVKTSTVVSRRPQPPMPGMPPPMPVISVQTTTVYGSRQSAAVAGAVTLTKKLNYLDVSVGLTACAFDTANQYQAQAGVAYYPFGNRKLVLGALAYHHTETNYKYNSLAFLPYVSTLIRNRVFLSASWLNNNGQNVTEGNAYLINNSLDAIVSRISGSVEYHLFRHLNLYALYSYDTRREKTMAFKYHYHVYLLGIKFIP